jgi:7,8-dihydropterin-6-yl-methyl-4-(beta-D-ribofuranosyl)aminobenzene 5'-phosphate synthase
MIDDSAIAIKTPHGVVVIAGCSHSGICNICEYAKKATGLPLYAVIGGFHLMGGGAGNAGALNGDAEILNGTIDYFKNENPKFIYPMHCVDYSALAKFHEIFGIQKLSVGDIIEL